MASNDLEQVPMTDQQKTDLAEVYKSFELAIRTSFPDVRYPTEEVLNDRAVSKAGEPLETTMNSILVSHGFAEGSGVIAWPNDGDLTLRGRR